MQTFNLSPQTIDALAIVISGGSANDPTPSIGVYRSGPKIELFMRACGIDFRIGSASRLPALTEELLQLSRQGEAEKLKMIIERSADPRDFVRESSKHEEVVKFLNTHLRPDGIELQHHAGRMRLVKAGTSAPIVVELGVAIQVYDFDTVTLELDRALANAETDPEDAVTAANSLLEGVCRSVLIELQLELPAKRDIQSLYKAVREPLGLSPTRTDLPPDAIEDIQAILRGVSSVVQGIGSLRTHAGDAHGREKGYRRIDSRIARLAIHTASAASLFIIETWQLRYPTKPLIRH